MPRAVEAVARLEPMPEREAALRRWRVDAGRGTLAVDGLDAEAPGGAKSWRFARLLDGSASEEAAFQAAAGKAVDGVAKGRDAMVVALGAAAASRRSFFGAGRGGEAGLAGRAASALFDALRALKKRSVVRLVAFSVRHERLRDLLSGKDGATALRKVPCVTAKSASQLLAHAMSACESEAPGHIVVQFEVKAKTTSWLTLVNLAEECDLSMLKMRATLAALASPALPGEERPESPAEAPAAAPGSALTRELASRFAGLVLVMLTLSLAERDRANTLATLQFAVECNLSSPFPEEGGEEEEVVLRRNDPDDTMLASDRLFEDQDPAEADFSVERVQRLSEIASASPDSAHALGDQSSMDSLANEIDSLLIDSRVLAGGGVSRPERSRSSIENELNTIRSYEISKCTGYEDRLEALQRRFEAESARCKRLEFDLDVERQRSQDKARVFEERLMEAEFERCVLQRSLVQRQECLQSLTHKLATASQERELLEAKLQHAEAALARRPSVSKALRVLGLDEPPVHPAPPPRRPTPVSRLLRLGSGRRRRAASQPPS